MPQNESSSREDQVTDAIAAYLNAVKQGEKPDLARFLADHAELTAELNSFLTNRSQFRMSTGHVAPGSTSQSCTPDSPPKQPASDPNEATLTFQQRDVPSARNVLRDFGDYELLQEIARGGMGVVYKARQVTLNRIVAVKMILGGQLAGPEDVQRFRTEAEAAAQLDHPGIVPIYEVGEQDGQHYFSMGFVEGQSLAKRVAEGPLEPRAAAEMVKTVSEAVQYAHDKGVIHRDLKPGNILLDKVGRPRVTDFGLAKLTGSGSDLTGTGQILGTPSYMPPEQASGKIDQIGPLADVYSLGAILYCLLTGRPPFQAASPLETLFQVQLQEPVRLRQLNSQVPLDLETITHKCLEKNSSRRYGSALELANELQRFLKGEPTLARPVSAFERAWRWCKRRPLIPSVVASVLAISLVSGLILQQVAATEREQGLRREVVAGFDALQNTRGPGVPFAIRVLEKLPRNMVLDELQSRYNDAEVERKLGLAYALADYGEADVSFLVSQIQRAAPDEVDNLATAFGRAREASLEAIHALAKVSHAEPNWRLKTRLAVVALHLDDDRIAADMCRIDERPDPIQRTIFIDELAAWHGDVSRLAPYSRSRSDPALRSGLCLAVGSIPLGPLPAAESEAWNPVLTESYKTALDNAMHSAAGWALRQWGIEVPALSVTSQPSEGRQWFVNSLGMAMLNVQPGQFTRRDGNFPDSKPQNVTLTRAFFLSDREVSVDQFQRFIDDPYNPKEDKPAVWQQRNGEAGSAGEHSRGAVSWYDAVLFCNWLSRKEGRTVCYERIGKKEKIRNVEYDAWRLVADASGYRLPTEAEWEYACRAGTTTDFASGSDEEMLRKYAIFQTSRAASGGSKLPNRWGLFDMHGNIWEWCHDWYEAYGEGDVNDPVGPSEVSIGASVRVFRGGSWNNVAAYWRSGYRQGLPPDERRGDIGFRVALGPVRPVK
jgi:formylglycine-generating enzyme required for sulfatase activity/predicted Ser/Thr protein kinase